MNIPQKIAVAMSACAVLIVLLLHYPVSGYGFERNVGDGRGVPCSVQTQSEWREEFERGNRSGATHYSKEQIQGMVDQCFIGGQQTETLPFDQWHTLAPVVGWFGPVINVLSVLATLVAMCAVVLYVFRPGAVKP